MENLPWVLILARSAQLRNSLNVLIASSARVQAIRLEEDVRGISRLNGVLPPALIVIAFDPSADPIPYALAAIKTRWPHTPTIALVDSETEFPRVLSAGAEAVLVKGVLAANLLKMVENLLRE